MPLPRGTALIRGSSRFSSLLPECGTRELQFSACPWGFNWISACDKVLLHGFFVFMARASGSVHHSAVVDLGLGAWPSEVVWCCAVVKHMAHRVSWADHLILPSPDASRQGPSVEAQVWKRASMLHSCYHQQKLSCCVKWFCILHRRER